MSIPLDRLYHYIESVASEVYNSNVLIYRFWPHGSKKIEDLHCIKEQGPDEHINCPQLICYDQEPLNYALYKDSSVRLGKKFNFLGDPNILPKRNLRVFTGNIYDHCLLLHSEKRSTEVELYQQDQFVPVYYWAHAIIARDWFRYAPYVNFTKNVQNTFLIYNRAWSGTREYRIKFMDLLIEHNLVNQCKTSFNSYDSDQYYKNHVFNNQNWKPMHELEKYFNPTNAPASSSANFDIADYNNTEFEVVLETLFDDQRQQLTEKILRPIACKHPFIVASTPGTLEYLRSYGFQTFGEIFDESYDLIQDPFIRMQSIIKTMKEIASWTPEYKLIQMKKITEVTNFNHAHFFSDHFFSSVITELKNNLRNAFDYMQGANIGVQYRDLKIKNIPGMRQRRKDDDLKIDRLNGLKMIKEHRKRNRPEVK